MLNLSESASWYEQSYSAEALRPIEIRSQFILPIAAELAAPGSSDAVVWEDPFDTALGQPFEPPLYPHRRTPVRCGIDPRHTPGLGVAGCDYNGALDMQYCLRCIRVQD